MARGRQRRMCLFGALSTKAVSTNRVSRSTPGLCVVALATALSMSFFTTGAPRFLGELEQLQRLAGLTAADEVHDDTRLARADAA